MDSALIEAYWQQYLDTLPEDHPHRSAAYTAWYFGDSPALADELWPLVKAGKKTATASLEWQYSADDPVPQVGDISIILSGSEEPVCIIETTEIRIVPYDQVDAQFAHDEGEGDRSLAYWRDAHWRYFTRLCVKMGWNVSEKMPVVCERFRVIYA